MDLNLTETFQDGMFQKLRIWNICSINLTSTVISQNGMFQKLGIWKVCLKAQVLKAMSQIGTKIK